MIYNGNNLFNSKKSSFFNNCLKSKKINKFIFYLFLNIIIIIILIFKRIKIKIAICTMGKKENLYIKEFILYYKKLGVDKIFIYDDNDDNSEKINDVIII